MIVIMNNENIEIGILDWYIKMSENLQLYLIVTLVISTDL